ncbi:MAG: TatD family deoxyribonuclease [Acidobacteria bacterium]|nr:MAG: TatD family deoxyribonuclease [Acidobacteriota bacterium]
MLVDSHCHLQSLDPEEREAALEAARERGVEGFLVPATKLDEADELLELCQRHGDVWCALGCHPHEAATWRRGDGERLSELLREPPVVAVGEIGLDFYYDHAPRRVQERVMREQCEVAIDAGLPVVVHNRESNEAMLELIAHPALDGLAADFHSFAGGKEMAAALIARDVYFGMSGMITFRAADNVREVIPQVPRQRLLVETDTPYLAPVPYRGKPNRPAYVVEVVERLAAELGIEVEEAVALTGENFFRLYAKAGPR